ncbi:hypothetical protein [Natronorubrum halophilum]|nr:hypothetical protein [Natronorubrum halophilum]
MFVSPVGEVTDEIEAFAAHVAVFVEKRLVVTPPATNRQTGSE